MNTDDKILDLLSNLIVLIKKHGWKTDRVRDFVRKNKGIGDFYSLAKTVIVLMIHSREK